MAYNKRTWLGRQGTGLNKFSIGGASPVTIVNQPDSVTQTGDALSAGNLNDLEDRIEDAFDDVDTELDTKADEQDITNLNNALSATNKRVENLEEAHGSYHEVDVKSVYTIPSGKGSNWLIDGLRGVSRAWNQRVNLQTISTYGYGTFTRDGYKLTITTQNGTANLGSWRLQGNVSLIVGHVYLIAMKVQTPVATTVKLGFNNTLFTGTSSGIGFSFVGNVIVATANDVSSGVYRLYYDTTKQLNGNTTYTVEIKDIILCDLTQYFSSDPSVDVSTLTIADIQQRYPQLLEPRDYDAGSLVDTTYEGVKSVGVNIWDEEWEVGFINDRGQNESASDSIRSKNYIPCHGGVEYYFGCQSYSSSNFVIYFYDGNKNMIPYTGPGAYRNGANPSDGIFTSPVGTCYMRFRGTNIYGASYKNDIQICLNSYTDKTNYHPYFKRTLTFPSPVSLKSAGAVAEEYYPESGRVTHPIGQVDLGTLDWNIMGVGNNTFYAPIVATNNYLNAICSKYLNLGLHDYSDMVDKTIQVRSNYIYIKDSAYTDAVTFKASLSGIILYYELATPSADTYVDPILDNLIATEAGGTIESILTTPVDDSMTLGYINL